LRELSQQAAVIFRFKLLGRE